MNLRIVRKFDGVTLQEFRDELIAQLQMRMDNVATPDKFKGRKAREAYNVAANETLSSFMRFLESIEFAQ